MGGKIKVEVQERKADVMPKWSGGTQAAVVLLNDVRT